MGDWDRLSRRDFLRLAGTTAAAAGLAACTPGASSTGGSTSARGSTVILGITDVWKDAYTKMLADVGFTKETGINVQLAIRPGTPDELITQLTGAIQAGKTPYDVVDLEDEVAITASRAGWLRGLDGVLPSGFWDDFPSSMMDMVKVWYQYKGETFRIPHNYEAQYTFYRKDWFDAKGVAVPRTWEDVAALGPVFTDTSKNVWAVEDGLKKGAFLNVFVAYMTKQAGGNSFDTDDHLRQSLEYVHDLMYKQKAMNPATLQKDYEAQNADYTADRVAYMRQWPYFYDVSRAKTDWFKEGRAEIAMPAVGPGGKGNGTYVAAWGWSIPKTTANRKGAEELVRFLTDAKNAPRMAGSSQWFLNARKSVLAANGNAGIAQFLKQYSDAGVIGTRPFHPKFVEALAVIEDGSSAFLTNQLSIDAAIKQMKDGMAALK